MSGIAEAFAVSLFSIAVAEFGDKTQLSLITLASGLRKPVPIFLGMIVAFTIVAGLGVLLGEALLAIIPSSTLTTISGLVFVIVGLLMLKVDVGSGLVGSRARNPFLTSIPMIVLAELGDKTQIATIALAARHGQPVAVFAGVMLAFVLIDGTSIVLADRLGKRLPASKVRKASAVIFVVLGILTTLGLV